MPYGTINAGTITPGSGNTLTIDETVDGTAIKDQDNMSSNSATHLATQQSIKAYVDTAGTNASITTLGTVATGTWAATDVAVAHGGTGASTHTANNVLIGAGTSAITSVAPSTSGNVLTSNGTVWTSAAGSVDMTGHVIQVVSSGYLSANNSGLSTTSTSLAKFFFADGTTPYQKQITGVESGNKVLVLVQLSIEVYGTPVGNNSGGAFGLGWNDGSSDETLIVSSSSDVMFQNNSSYTALYLSGHFLQFLHIPDVTDPIYFLEGHSRSTSNSCRVGTRGANFTLMEIQS